MDNAALLRDLAHAKAVFQLRAISAVIGAGAIVEQRPEGENARSAVEGEACASGAQRAIAQHPSEAA